MSTENRNHNTTNEIVEWDAVTLSQKIRSKDVSCAEVLHSYLDQVDRLNPIVNAIVDYQDRDTLNLRANELDTMLAKDDYCGPLHGMPQAPKDTMPAKGLVTSKGSPIFAGQKSTTDSVVFERMRRGGSIFIGRTNCPEFALGGHTYNSVYGATTNAFDKTRSAGGSSGGAAVATALHMLPVADGSDMMGSLRTPAAFNNVFGFRTSMGAVPHGPTDELFFQQFSVTGPMARNIPDLALLLSVQAGYDSRLPLTRKQEDPAHYLNVLDRDFKGCKIGWLGDLEGKLSTDKGLLSLCESTLQYFEAIGCTVENAAINTNLENMWNAWIDLRSFYFGHTNMALYNDERTRAMLKPEAIWEFERAIPMNAARVFEASKIRSNFYRAMMTLFDKFDFLIMPAAQVFPFPVEEHWPRNIRGQTMDTYHRWMEAVLPATMSGLPSMAAPAGFNAQGLPAGIQIIGRPQSDFEVLQISHAYDLASQFSTHRSSLL